MKYNLDLPQDIREAEDYLAGLIQEHKVVDIKVVKPKRSRSQNNYLHLLIGAYGAHFGWTMEEAKDIYKQISHDTYFYEKNDRQFTRSSADLTVEEMTKTIEKFRAHSADLGYPLPAAMDPEHMRWLENEIERSRAYL